MARMIFTGLSPNAERDDVALAFRLLAAPWAWVRGSAPADFERIMRAWIPTAHAFAFESGRTALHAILSTLGLSPDDEVLLQAYTCVAVPNAVLWSGARPVYVDVDEQTFNMSPEDLERKITPKSRAVIIQHTFGNPADADRLIAAAKRHGLFVIEDCAHALGSEVRGKRVGTFGDAAFFSFGRDKVISSVFGGLATTSRSDTAESLQRIQFGFPLPGRGWVMRQLLHPVVLSAAKATYDILGFGKLIIEAAKRLHVISKAVTPEEKRGGRPAFTGKRMPNALARLALRQFSKLERFNDHRRTIAGVYDREFSSIQTSASGRALDVPVSPPGGRHVYLRYTIRTPHAQRVRRALKQEGILLGDWYDVPIAPPGVHHDLVFYRPGSCPTAERLAMESLNLPTDIHVTEADARRIVARLLPHI
ncbi:MAG TPA: aminotransferase class I/II-fold pyridoxal phosphate-dependent enzyme [Candidatus Methylomirabilis sp.]|nr:aminotransferase class I/II-fold pyridoxal phosphate-dependent enzyme [Candidatus Methylomirabilis sp.]